MERRKQLYIGLTLTVLAVSTVPAYFLLPAAAIEYSAADIARPTGGCVYYLWSSGDETRFLIQMGRQSIPAVTRKLDDPKIRLKPKIHLAWILSQIGDHSHFRLFIDGLASDRRDVQYIACARMCDFPAQCLRHLGEILSVPGERKHDCYWDLILQAADTANLAARQTRAVDEIIAPNRLQYAPLTDDQKRRILAEFHHEPDTRDVTSDLKQGQQSE